MKKILFLIFFLGGLFSGLSAYSQVTGFTVMNVNPGTTLTAGQTVQIKYSLDFIMHQQKSIKIVLTYGPRFTYVGMASTSSNLFSTPMTSTGVTQLNTIVFNAGDENWNATAEFTVTFTVNYSECNSASEFITAVASTMSPLTPPDNISVSTNFNLNNLNSNPSVTIEKLEGEECQTAIYKITSFGLDNPNSLLKLTVPTGTSVVNVSNSAGFPITFGGSFPIYTWSRNGNALNTLQIFYVMLNFSPAFCNSSGVKELKVEFSTHNVCNSGGSVTVFSTPLPIGDCCNNPPPVPIAPGVTLEKYMEKTAFRYFPRPDNCKTHDYIIELTNYTANPLSNLNLSDNLSNVLAGQVDGLLITDINVELISLTGASQSINYSVTPATPLYGGTTLTSGSGYQRIYVQSTASWPAYDGIWAVTPNFNLSTANFPGYSKLRIKITFRLDNPNTSGMPYMNIAKGSFNMNGLTYLGSDTLTTSVGTHDPVITLNKRVKNVTAGSPYQSSVNAAPGDALEFEIRIKNIGMASVNATLNDLATFMNPSTGSFYTAPTSVMVSLSSPGYTAAEITAWQTALTNGFNNTGTSIVLPPIKAATCPGYTEIIIKYKVLVLGPAIVLCNSLCENTATLAWNWNGAPNVVSSMAKVNIDLFQNIHYKFEAICDTTSLPWSTTSVNGVPGTFMYFKASIRNTNSFQVNGLKMMVQLPNTADNISVHGSTTTLTSVMASPTTAFTPLFYSATPPFATSPTTPDSWLNSAATLPANGANPIALYTMGNLAGSGGTMTISYRVLVPINVPGSYYRSVMGVSMSLGAGCDTIIKKDTLTVKIVTSNPCKTLTSCEQIMFDASVQYLGANNFKIALTNILDVANFNVELMDIIVHQPYKDCPATGAFVKPRIPFALGAFSSTNPPFTLVSASPVGYRYYPLANNSGSTVSFANASFNFTATVSASPVCQLVFPVNIRFKSKTDNCKICERTIYLRMNHVTTFIVPNWEVLIQDDLIKSKEDPLNVELNKGREELAQSEVGKQIEKWYADVKADSSMAKALENYPMEVFGMFAIGRRMIEKEGTLTAADVAQITKGMQLVDKELTPAPKGLIAEIVTRLNNSVGMKWPALLANLKK